MKYPTIRTKFYNFYKTQMSKIQHKAMINQTTRALIGIKNRDNESGKQRQT